MPKHFSSSILLLCLSLLPGSAGAQPLARPGSTEPVRYALILDEPALGEAARSRSTETASRRQRLLQRQASLRSALRTRGVTETGAAHTLLNAIFITAPADRLPELRGLPGVAAVIPMHRLRRSLNKVVDLVNARPAWAAAGGAANAGAGVKIAILDTGIDATHPGFQDSSLAPPAGYPKLGSAADAAYATNKIIAVRSFVGSLAAGDGTPEFSRADDLSARDRVGHGTAVAMIAAGVAHESPLGTISGLAPKAWLGNYKIFGSPGVNDFTTSDVVLQALEAAFNDGMDVAILSMGDLGAMWTSTDRGAPCGREQNAACDPWADAVSNAIAGGMAVVTPAGNSGFYGPGTIDTPGHVPAAITVGATVNTRTLASTARIPDGTAFPIRFGDGQKRMSALTAPLKPVNAISSTEEACRPLAEASLAGSIALIARGELVNRGNCTFGTKVMNAQAAGAVAALIFREKGASALFEMTGLGNATIPAALIPADAGATLKEYLAAHPGTTITLLPATAEFGAAAESVAAFSGRGPSVSGAAIKPDLVAPGAGIYTAAQNYDPNGDLYGPDRYAGVDGTSFAAAVAGGAVALVKQAHPRYSPAQLKSAVTNTATGAWSVESAGAGKLNVQAAVASTVTVEPATAGFGVLGGTTAPLTVKITNTGTAAATLQLAGTAAVVPDPARLSLEPGQSADVKLSLSGAKPGPGAYEGFVTIAGAAAPLRIPYSYFVAEGVPRTLIPLNGHEFVTEAGSILHWVVRAVDRFGAPAPAVQIRFSPPDSVYAANPETDDKGVAEAFLLTAERFGEQSFQAILEGGVNSELRGRTRPQPEIAGDGVRDAASALAPEAFAPGSYISLFGSGLSEGYGVFQTSYLPPSLAGVSVSFDAPSIGVQAPGRVTFVSGDQINVQVPWELTGATSAVMKVTLSQSASLSIRSDSERVTTYRTRLIDIPIAPYSPAFFTYPEPGTGRTLAAALDDTYQLLSSANPARGGRAIQNFMNGLGDVKDGTRPGSGESTPGAPLAEAKAAQTVTIGGQPAQLLFSGLAPFNIGLYQVNVIVPAGLASGLQPVELSIGGVSAKSSIVVQ